MCFYPSQINLSSNKICIIACIHCIKAVNLHPDKQIAHILYIHKALTFNILQPPTLPYSPSHLSSSLSKYPGRWLQRWGQSDSWAGLMECVWAPHVFSVTCFTHMHTHGDRCGAAGEYVALKEALVIIGTRLSAVPCRTTGGCVVTGWYMGGCIETDMPSHSVIIEQPCKSEHR